MGGYSKAKLARLRTLQKAREMNRLRSLGLLPPPTPPPAVVSPPSYLEEGEEEVEFKVEVKEEVEAVVDEDMEDGRSYGHSIEDSLEGEEVELSDPPTNVPSGFGGTTASPSSPLPPQQIAAVKGNAPVSQRGNRKVKQCILCAKETSSSKKGLSAGSSVSSHDADLLAMFILKKMLELPGENLQEYLTTFGHPRNWISICDQCKPKINEAFAVQREIGELEVKLRKFQREMKDIVSLTFVKNRKKLGADEMGRKGDPLRVTRETWRHVGKDVSTKPIPAVIRTAGNRLQSAIASSSAHSASPMIRQDSPVIFPSDDDDDDDAFPSDGDHGDENYPESCVPVADKSLQNKLEEEQGPIISSVKSVDKVQDTSKSKLDKRPPLRFNRNGTFAQNGYTCQLCPTLKPMKLESFVRHILFHSERPYRCLECGVYFTGSDTEISKCTKLLHKKEGVPDNHVCTKESLLPVTFQSGKLLECGHCQEIFGDEEERRVHEKRIHSQHEARIPLLHHCSLCSRKFRDYVEWRLHRALEHPTLAKLGCFYCDEIFVIKTREGVDLEDAESRTKHMMERHKAKSKTGYLLECEFCGENFPTEVLLSDHLGKEHDADDNGNLKKYCLSCPICFQRRRRRANIQRHILSMHAVGVGTLAPKDKFICDMCGYETVEQGRFQEHKFMKHGIEPEGGRPVHSCSETDCPFKCTSRTSLKRHMMKAHNAERPVKCEICGKGFFTQSHLKGHQEIHLNARDKPFQCELCGSSFAVKNYLYIHMRLSHQNRPFASTHKKKRRRRRSSETASKLIAATTTVPCNVEGSGLSAQGSGTL